VACIGIRNWESAGGSYIIPRTSNVRAILHVRGTSELTDLGLRYCANESIGFVNNDAPVTNHDDEYSERWVSGSVKQGFQE
jgi:hypothetical protein